MGEGKRDGYLEEPAYIETAISEYEALKRLLLPLAVIDEKDRLDAIEFIKEKLESIFAGAVCEKIAGLVVSQLVGGNHMIKFTVFTDLHYDEVSDGDRRIDELVEHIKDTKPDFVVSLGDLCKPVTKNCETVLKKLYSVDVPVYHTIGNHETDTCEIETTAKFLSLKNTYYSFGYGDVKFIVLDSCFFRKNGKEYPYYKKNYKKENMIFPVVPSEEIEWLNQQLNDKKKYVIFSHHSLVNDYKNRGIYNRNEIRKLLEDKEVLLCMNGHDHGDELAVVNDIPYYTVNSATYIWCGSQIDASQELREKYKHLNGILLYKQALCVDVEIDESEIRILGMNGEYLSVTPDDVGLCDYKWNGVSIRPRTSSYMIKIDNRK